MTAIEQALFRSTAAHWIAAFDIAGDTISVTLHPCDRADLKTRARFEKATVVSVDSSHADVDSRAFPWDIIGFDSEPRGRGRWRYCLHTDPIEYCFEAGWPVIDRVG